MNSQAIQRTVRRIATLPDDVRRCQRAAAVLQKKSAVGWKFERPTPACTNQTLPVSIEPLIGGTWSL